MENQIWRYDCKLKPCLTGAVGQSYNYRPPLLPRRHRGYQSAFQDQYRPPNLAGLAREWMYDSGPYHSTKKARTSRTPDIEDPSGAFRMRDRLLSAIHSCSSLCKFSSYLGAEVRPEPNSRVGYYSVSREKQDWLRGRMA